jgi:hypothetical protein
MKWNETLLPGISWRQKKYHEKTSGHRYCIKTTHDPRLKIWNITCSFVADKLFWEHYERYVGIWDVTGQGENIYTGYIIHSFIHGFTTLCWPWPLLQFRNHFYTDGRTPWMSDYPSQGRYLHIAQHKHRINKQISMPWVGFELTIPAFEREKTVHALDCAATVIDQDT